MKNDKISFCMIPVSIFSMCFYQWEVGLPDVKYPFNWIWAIVQFIVGVIFEWAFFSCIFSVLAEKDEVKISDVVKVSSIILIAFWTFVLLVESRR